jgi:cation diffusion facilitator CzcD-associated flavoprotein CzcO
MSTPQTRPSTPISAATGNADVLPAGAGISGIGADYRLKTRHIRRSWSPARRARTEGTAGD